MCATPPNMYQQGCIAQPLTERAHWIGATDPDLRTFDIIMHIPNGTTYNAYSVRGSDGVAVIDTVKAEMSDQFFSRLESIASYDEIKLIVLNHLKPDHAGTLQELMRRAPQAQIYISRAAQAMLKALLNMQEIPYTPVETGSRVSLGDRNLIFLNTPLLHCPGMQCTHLEEEGVLFSGDVSGSHYCFGDSLFNDELNDFSAAFETYFEHIMRPFKQHVLSVLELLEPLRLDMIAPSHGPILRDRPRRYLHRYREMSLPRMRLRDEDEKKSVIVFYVSAYGNTKYMAEAIFDGMCSVSGCNVLLYDLEGRNVLDFINQVEEADAILIGSPTFNGDAIKPVWDLLSVFSKIGIKGKVAAAFGSYGWSGEAVRILDERLRGLKMHVPVAGLRIKLVPTPTELDECRAFGKDICDFILGNKKERAIDMSDLLAS